MKIKAVQKTTLIDYPNKIACTLFLYGCDFRCDFCHNPELVIEDFGKDLSEEEIFNFLKDKKKYLEGVCMTGGEPLLTLTKEFLQKIKKMGYLIKIDTNGNSPEKLKGFIQDGLVDFIAMDLKSSKENYSYVTNTRVDLKRIEESMEAISRFPEHEFRTTIAPIKKGGKKEREFIDEGEIEKIAKWIIEVTRKDTHNYFLQKFVPRKDKLVNKEFEKFSSTPDLLMKNLLIRVKKHLHNAKIRD